MQKPKASRAAFVLFAIASALAGYFYIQVRGLQNELSELTTKESELATNAQVQQQLNEIDALLFEGEYAKAIAAYRSGLKSKGDSGHAAAIEMRINFARNVLSSLKPAEILTDSNSINSNADSIRTLNAALPEEVRKYDSVSFALDKANLQIQNLRRQLQKKNSGEYLTFKTSKGKRLHYVGQVKNKKANGRGVALLVTGSRYEGEWKNNLREGSGAFYWPDGQYYIGDYKADKRHGKGTYYWPNGEKYIGQWADDHRNGEGTFYGKDGEIIAKGMWKNDKLDEQNK